MMTDLLSNLRVVKGSISKKNFISILNHFHIYDGRIQGSNGKITIDVRCDDLEGIRATIPADKFVKAINSCKDEIDFKLTDTNMLIKSGSFKARLPLGNHKDYPMVDIANSVFQSLDNSPILPVLKRLAPFIGDSTSHPWSAGILIQDGYAYATNNPVMARVPYTFPMNVTLPSHMITELLRINVEPLGMALTDESIFFNIGNSNWIKALGTGLKWPNVALMFDVITSPSMVQIPTDLTSAIKTVLPFCADPSFPRIDFTGNGVTTADGDSRAMVENIALVPSSWHAENMLLVLSEATRFDLNNYPKACPWAGEGIQGLIIGVNK